MMYLHRFSLPLLAPVPSPAFPHACTLGPIDFLLPSRAKPLENILNKNEKSHNLGGNLLPLVTGVKRKLCNIQLDEIMH